MNTKIVEKIQKLFSLSESSNEHEAHVAMLKAQELLIKHKLSMKEVRDIRIQKTPILDKETNISFTRAKWKAELAELVSENFGCCIYFNIRRTNYIVFWGREEDVIVCNIVLEYAIDCINSAVRKLRYKYRRDGYSTRGLENDYAIGFIKGLTKKFNEQKQLNQEWGLVLVKDSDVVDAYSKIEFAQETEISTFFQGHGEAFEQGYKDGEKFSISDKIAREGDEVLQIS